MLAHVQVPLSALPQILPDAFLTQGKGGMTQAPCPWSFSPKQLSL